MWRFLKCYIDEGLLHGESHPHCHCTYKLCFLLVDVFLSMASCFGNSAPNIRFWHTFYHSHPLLIMWELYFYLPSSLPLQCFMCTFPSISVTLVPDLHVVSILILIPLVCTEVASSSDLHNPLVLNGMYLISTPKLSHHNSSSVTLLNLPALFTVWNDLECLSSLLY